MNMGNRWIAGVVLAITAVFALPQAASAQQMQDEEREYVDEADVVMRGGQPYYRYSNDGRREKLHIERDPAGQALYYRVIGRDGGGYYRRGYDRYTRCDSRGICRVEYYDPRYDRRGNYRVYDDYARRYVRGEL